LLRLGLDLGFDVKTRSIETGTHETETETGIYETETETLGLEGSTKRMKKFNEVFIYILSSCKFLRI